MPSGSTWSLRVASLEEALLAEYLLAKADIAGHVRTISDLTSRERAGMLIKVFGGVRQAERAIESMPIEQKNLSFWRPVKAVLAQAIQEKERNAS